MVDLKRRNEELHEENGRLARKDDETSTLLSNQKAQQQEQVGQVANARVWFERNYKITFLYVDLFT